MTIYGEGPDYVEYMRNFIKGSPWKWLKCEKCGSWISMAKARVPCPLCPPQPKKDRRSGEEDTETYDPVTKAYVPKGFFE